MKTHPFAPKGLADNLKQIEKEIYRLRKMKTGLMKDVQQYCPHKNLVHKTGPLNQLLFRAYQSPSYDDFVQIKVYCKDCGKRL